MVDLVKIRKKAKKEKEQAEESAAQPRAAEAEPAPPPMETAPQGTQEPARSAESDPHLHPAVDPLPAAPPSKLDRFKQMAGQRREEIDEIETAEAVNGDQLELLTFAIASEQYAVEIERIVEIVTPRVITRIPNSEASVVGITSLRGTIVTLVDVRRKLRQPAGGQTADTRVIVVDNVNETLGFEVDRVLRVVKSAKGEIEPHPVVSATELDESVRGVFRVSGALTILLDLDKLLGHNAMT